jgi:hypothetical protein
VNSPWQVPLPQEENTTSRVVVYFYNGGWIPITFYPLVDAIRLHLIGISSGMDIVVFPPEIDPRVSVNTLAEWELTDKPSRYEITCAREI